MPTLDAKFTPTSATTRAAPGRAFSTARRRLPATRWWPQWMRSVSTVQCWCRRSPCIATTRATPSRFMPSIPAGSAWSSRSIRTILPLPTPSPTGRRRRVRSASGSCCATMSRPTPPTPASTGFLPPRRNIHPVNLLCWCRLEQAAQLAARNPNTQLVIDHLGLQQPFEPPPPAEPFAELPKVLALAAHPNIAIKISGACTLVARTVPVQRHLGSARPHLRRFGLRPLHVGHRLDACGRIADLRAGGRGVPRHRPPV